MGTTGRAAWAVGVRFAAGIGAAIAGVELVALGVGAAVPLGAARWAAVSALAVALDVALVVPIVAGIAATGVGRGSARVGVGVWLGALVVGLAVVWPGVQRLLAEGQGFGGVVLAGVTFGLAAGAGIGAALASRRELDPPEVDVDGEVVQRRPVPVVALGLGVALLGAMVGGFANRERPTTSSRADGPTVVLVSVDGLRAGEDEGLAPLTAGAVRFGQAVTPTPQARAANATLLTGLHPLRHRVLDEGDLLSRAYTTAFEALAEAGWPTGAFVSSPAAAAGSGLEQGFQRYDDAWGLLPRTAVGRWLVRVLPEAEGRDGSATVARFAAWAGAQGGPYAAWIHLDAARGDLEAAAAALGEVLAGARREDRLVLVVAGSVGRPAPGRGAEGVLGDEAVHVPLAVVLPEVGPGVVDAQVRLMDVAPTLASAALGLGSLDQSEGLSLAPHATGARTASLSCTLVGRAPSGEVLLGVRNNGVKVVLGADGSASVYELDEDPRETVDRAADEPGLVEQARALLAADRAALVSICGASCEGWHTRNPP